MESMAYKPILQAALKYKPRGFLQVLKVNLAVLVFVFLWEIWFNLIDLPWHVRVIRVNWIEILAIMSGHHCRILSLVNSAIIFISKSSSNFIKFTETECSTTEWLTTQTNPINLRIYLFAPGQVCSLCHCQSHHPPAYSYNILEMTRS